MHDTDAQPTETPLTGAESVFEFIIPLLVDARKSRTTLADIAGKLAAAHSLSNETATALTAATVNFFRVLGPLGVNNDEIVLHNQVSDYFLRSFLWFAHRKVCLVDNWNRDGAADGKLSNLLDAPPTLLKIMEEKRLRYSEEKNESPEPSRYQDVSCNLIKRTIRNKAHFLHQWDDKAGQYQLIGGKAQSLETPRTTAMREASEEIAGHPSHGSDFTIVDIGARPYTYRAVSMTYGALTEYRVSPFYLKFAKPTLMLGPADRWISLPEMRAGETHRGERIAVQTDMLDAGISGGLEGLPDSFDTPRKSRLGQWAEAVDWIEFEIRVLGIVIRPAKLIEKIRSRRRDRHS